MTSLKIPRTVISAAALAGLTALGGVGAVMSHDTATGNGISSDRLHITEVATTSSKASSSASSSSEESTESSSNESPAPGNGDAQSQLIGMLPPGFNSSNCSAANQGVADALATVDCTSNSQSNGPSSARFALFGDQATLDNKFQVFVSEDKMQECPGGMQSPGDWHYNNTPNEVAGHIACGTYQGTPDLTWTQNAELMLGNIQGNNINSLYNYWAHPGGSNQMGPQAPHSRG